MRQGWLIEQLPRVMQADPLLHGLVTAIEEVEDTVVERIDGLEAQVDPATASEEMLAFLASWLGLHTNADDDPHDVRRLVHGVGGSLGARGTARSLERLLSAATGSSVQVSDAGGVFRRGERVPAGDHRIEVVIESAGPLTRDQISALCAEEIPVGAVVGLTVQSEEA